MESLAFMTHPVIVSLLLAVGSLGLVKILFRPGFGVSEIISITAFVLYFGSHMLLGYAGLNAILLTAIGFFMLVAEIYLPGGGLFGILGIGALITGIILSSASLETAITGMGVTFIVVTAGVAFCIKKYGIESLFRKIILENDDSIEVKKEKNAYGKIAVDETGTSLTPLRPSGMGKFNDKQIDVITEGSFIETGKAIKVVKIEGIKVVVREL